MFCFHFDCCPLLLFSFFFFNDTATTEIYTLSLHDALPISVAGVRQESLAAPRVDRAAERRGVTEPRRSLSRRPTVGTGLAAPATEKPCVEPRRRHAVGGPEPEDEALGEALARRELLEGVERQPTLLERVRVAGRGPHVRVADATDEAARAGPGGEVLRRAPVDLVVARAEAGPRVVRDLVVLEAALRRAPREAPVLRHHRLFAWQTGHAGGAPEAPRVQREAVGGEVVGVPVEDRVDGVAPALEVERRQAVHQIDADVVDAGVACRLEGPARPPPVVEPAEPPEDRVVERLDAEAQTVHPGRAVRVELLASHALGVALDGDLRARSDGEAAPEAREDLRQCRGVEERRGPTAEKDGLDPHARDPRERAEQLELAPEGGEVACHRARVERRRVEAAVVAALRAERDVDVEPQRVSRWRVVRQD